MLPRRRLLIAVALAAVVALPAGVLAGMCAGNACRREERATARVPFCSLREELRSLIAAGFRDGRAPHVMTVRPGAEDEGSVRIPLVFSGTGVTAGAGLPAGATLDAVSPTLAEIIGLRRPHPGVRSGEALAGIASGEAPRLVLLVAWKEVTSRDLEQEPQRWPVLRGLLESGTGTLEATPGSLPLDPPALLATIGTGGLPRDHGVTGSFVRDDRGAVVPPWATDDFVSVIATLADDLDELGRQAPRIGLVGGAETDRGLIGGNWYIENDEDDVVIAPSLDRQIVAAERLLGSGYGRDLATDLLAVAMQGPVSQLDSGLGRLVEAAERASGDSLVVALAGAPTDVPERQRRTYADELQGELTRLLEADVTDEALPSGVFLDQKAMTRSGLTDDRVVAALRGLPSAEGERAFLDVFPAIAVTFARYC